MSKVVKVSELSGAVLADGFAEIERYALRVGRFGIHPDTMVLMLKGSPTGRSVFKVEPGGDLRLWGASVYYDRELPLGVVLLTSAKPSGGAGGADVKEVRLESDMPLEPMEDGFDLREHFVRGLLLDDELLGLKESERVLKVHESRRVCQELLPAPENLLGIFGDPKVLRAAIQGVNERYLRRAGGYPDVGMGFDGHIKTYEISEAELLEGFDKFVDRELDFKPVIMISSVLDYGDVFHGAERENMEIISGALDGVGLMGFFWGVYLLAFKEMLHGSVYLLGIGHNIGTDSFDKDKVVELIIGRA